MVWVRNSSQLMVVPILGIAKRSFKVQPKPFAKWGTVFNFVVLDALIFYEQGTVAPNTGELWKNIKNSYGFGTRIVLSSFVFRVDVGFSEEGSEATVFFGYPF